MKNQEAKLHLGCGSEGLVIETPDFEWCRRKYLNLTTLRGTLWNTLVGLKYRKNYFKTNKWKILRHVFGSKEV